MFFFSFVWTKMVPMFALGQEMEGQTSSWSSLVQGNFRLPSIGAKGRRPRYFCPACGGEVPRVSHPISLGSCEVKTEEKRPAENRQFFSRWADNGQGSFLLDCVHMFPDGAGRKFWF